jgi:hypothetical protein
LEVALKTPKVLVWILIIGTAWGVAELFAKDLLADLGITTGVSVLLAIWAVLLLSIARGLWNKIGSSALIGLVAASFKFMGPSTNACHLLGIASIGLIFDLFASSLLSRGQRQWWRHALVGGLTAFGARSFFVLYAIHIAHLDRWVAGGSPMALDHVLRGGSVIALAAVLLTPLGFRIGGKAAALMSPTAADREKAQSEIAAG